VTRSRTFFDRTTAACAIAVAIVASIGIESVSANGADLATDVIVTDVPVQVRDGLRSAQVYGFDGTRPIMVLEDQHAVRPGEGNSYPAAIESDGTATRLPAGSYGPVVDGRMVWDYGYGSVQSKVLATGEYQGVEIPSGYTSQGYTADGVIVRTSFSPNQTLPQFNNPVPPIETSLIPWGSDDLLSITGIPATELSYGSGGSGQPHGVVLSSISGESRSWWVVDTTTRRAHLLDTGSVIASGLNGASLAWITSSGSTRTAHLGSIPLNSGPVVPSASFTLTSSITYPRIVPFGSGALLSREAFSSQLSLADERPLTYLSSDGISTEIVKWAHDLKPDSRGGAVAVTASTTTDQRLVRIDPNALTLTSLYEVPPVQAVVFELSVSDSYLVVTDSSSSTTSVRRYPLDVGGDSLAIEESKVLATSADVSYDACWYGAQCSGVMTDGMHTAWTKDNRLMIANGEQPAHQSIELDGPLADLSENWVLDRQSHLIDTSTGDREPGVYAGSTGSLDDAVSYRDSSQLWTAPESAVVARDLRSGASELWEIASNCSVSNPETAGAWMLYWCRENETTRLELVDLISGDTLNLPLDGSQYRLGNGFIVRTLNDSVSWSPVGELNWRALGSKSRYSGSVSVSSGDLPLVAWVDSALAAHIALLPVAGRDDELVRPSGVTSPPNAPAIATTGSAGTASRGVLTISWSDDPGADLIGRVITVTGDSYEEFFLPPQQMSLDVPGRLSERFQISVRAENAAGARTSTTSAVINGSTPAPSPTPTPNPSSTTIRPPRPTPSPSTSPTSPTAQAVPVPTIGRLPNIVTMPTVTVPVTRDPSTANVDIRVTASSVQRPYSGTEYPPDGLQRASTAPYVSAIVPGETLCFQARARTSSGKTSAWSANSCVTAAQDSGAFSRVGKWSKAKGPAYFGGSTLKAVKSTSRLSVQIYYARSVTVLATTCPTCGSLAIRDATGKIVKKISLVSRSMNKSAMLTVNWPKKRKGTFTVGPLNSKSKVAIDGLVVETRSTPR